MTQNSKQPMLMNQRAALHPAQLQLVRSHKP